MNNTELATLIAQAIINAQADSGAFCLEPVSDDFAPYDGVKIIRSNKAISAGSAFRCIDLYLCDDEPLQPVWMLDTYDGETGDCNPVPFTATALEAALAWMVQA